MTKTTLQILLPFRQWQSLLGRLQRLLILLYAIEAVSTVHQCLSLYVLSLHVARPNQCAQQVKDNPFVSSCHTMQHVQKR